MAVGRRGDGTVGPVGGPVTTYPTIVPREGQKVERRDAQNARYRAIQERVDAYKAAGEKIPEHLATLLKEARGAGEHKETRTEEVPDSPKSKSTPADYSVDNQGYPVPREAPEPGHELPETPGEYETKEPVEKFPDFANPAKRGDLIPQAAHDRDVVPDELKGKGKTEEQIKEDREQEAAKAAVGKPTNPRRAKAAPPKDAVVAPPADEVRTPAPEPKAQRGRPDSTK